MSKADSSNVKDAPAPWTLSGQVAYFFVHNSSEALSSSDEYSIPTVSPFRGGRGGILLIRYADSPVGPYDEFLLIPGCYQFGQNTYYRVTKIYVSTMDSVTNGRRNWAVPKKLAIFRWSDNDTMVKIFLPNHDEPFCTLKVRPRLYCFPASSAVIPASLRTLLQPPMQENDASRCFLKTVFTCSGWFRPLVQLIEFHTDGKEIPSHEQLSLYKYGFGYEAFTLVFPKPEELSF
jgi:hypothetical protein